ncbi:2-C-methyl-D-erythritol 4-phosphate cytidylyltransferase [Nocardioides daedukensis]|uniref:2-C-methyl-D-erythritol 4-phosphate cytidylyltransferase n=1 Tax=Nocardioides daedukensis TaxID=634462 RepID=A0A7Y9S0W9_9ACTN|nr:2-C-methyl-D-erythritol 4-phosphate cytidylyltransferase [Nocardioides daedukensis]
MRTVAVLLAGGVGSRVGAGLPKQLLEVAGKPLLAHCLATFDAHPGIDEIVVMMVPTHLEAARELAAPHAKVTAVLPGAESRDATTRAALAALGDDVLVLLHDAARPLLDAATITACLSALADHDAVTVAIASADTVITTAADGSMDQTPDRAGLRRLQTPQGFRAPVIRRAHELALADPRFVPTDDATVVRRYLPEVTVAVVEGSERNLKVTTALDLVIAEQLLR